MTEEKRICYRTKAQIELWSLTVPASLEYGCDGRTIRALVDAAFEPDACCRAAVEALEKIAEHAGSHTIKADDPARSYYGWGYVYDLASAALSAVSGAK